MCVYLQMGCCIYERFYLREREMVAFAPFLIDVKGGERYLFTVGGTRVAINDKVGECWKLELLCYH